ncbi:hypothetical protein [Parachlamydia acanthamoebae]|uniref:hypothetical protein n=1 Tax=Parachlamydia acanthamoebae TaxID=83552 RepID=UPI0012BA8CE7|nr:hypothetical protein [Parachlamydia acanthamoebae]
MQTPPISSENKLSDYLDNIDENPTPYTAPVAAEGEIVGSLPTPQNDVPNIETIDNKEVPSLNAICKNRSEYSAKYTYSRK